jgi:hypothetical protein
VITSVFVSRKREQMNRYSEEQSTTEYSVVSYESPGVIGHLARLTLQPLQRRYLPGTKEENTVVRNPHSQNRSQNRRRGRQRSTKRRDQRVEIRQHATRGSAPKSLASESNSAGLCRSWCSVRLNLGAVRCSACAMRIQGAAHNAQVVRSPVRRAEQRMPHGMPLRSAWLQGRRQFRGQGAERQTRGQVPRKSLLMGAVS